MKFEIFNKRKVQVIMLLSLIWVVGCNDSYTGKVSKTKTKEFKKMDNKKDGKLVPLFIPTLSSILLVAEEKKGSPLEKDEVYSIRDNSSTIMVPRSMIDEMDKKRGYSDIDPENCWNAWQITRKTLIDNEKKSNHEAMTLDNPSNNPKMRTAEEKAEKTLDKFRKYIKKHSKTPAMIKYRVEDTNSASRMWLFVDKDLKNSFEASLFEVPSDFTKYKAGDSFIIKDSEILDWMINDDGDIYGAYTIREQRENMSSKEREEMDSYMGAKRYLDLN